ncbi:hypothetical protein PM082_005145 [Marasmius tenuissimus]|nr:hypothetical protein PM082_005145 [Marasmius tenuissimus]
MKPTEEQINILAGLKHLTELNLKNTWSGEDETLIKYRDIIQAAKKKTCVVKISSDMDSVDLYR